jgi:O-antigen ligase
VLAIPHRAAAVAHGWRERLVALSKGSALQRLFAVAAAALIWMGLLLSPSRARLVAGIAAAVTVVVHYRAARAARWTAAIGVGVLLVLLTLDLAQAPGERFIEVKDDLGARAGRLAVWRDARSLVASRPVLGWGFGTFESAYPTVQSANIDMHYDHAHNGLARVDDRRRRPRAARGADAARSRASPRRHEPRRARRGGAVVSGISR